MTDAYGRRCSITGERTLPVLEAAHIQPYSEGGEHRVDNGMLLRSDLHTLFGRGYVTVTPDLKLEVSRRLKEDWENGRDYYAMRGRELRPPDHPEIMPSRDFLRWHNSQRYLG
ncbi:MAG: HNH endonuclease [Thermoplasmata archaeon]